MPRHSRELSDTGVYHIMLRGNERKNIFQDDEDKLRFLEGIEAKHKEAEFAVYAYCLMDNHVHLLLNQKELELASIMKSIAVRYASYYNWKHSREGHVFQDRYKSEVIEDERYLLAAVRYIHNNPVKAGIAASSDGYTWSSYGDYLLGRRHPWLDTDFVLGMISDNRTQARHEFKRFSLVADEIAFIEIKENKAIRTQDEGRTYLAEICRARGWELTRIKEDKRLRTAIICHLRNNTGLSQRVIADLLDVHKSVVEKVK
ncbi:MAG: transposase [Syntrophomonadaceae bacterium]